MSITKKITTTIVLILFVISLGVLTSCTKLELDNKADIQNISVSQNGILTYNGQEQTPELNVEAKTQNGETATFVYSKSSEGEFTSIIPTFKNAGIHKLYFKVSAENHNDSSVKECQIVVNKALIKACNITQSGMNGNVPMLNINVQTWGNEQVSITYSKDENGTYAPNIPEFNDIGIQRLYYNIVAENHFDHCGSLDIIVAETALAEPINLKWTNGIASWSQVETATSYLVQLYNDNNFVKSFLTATTSINLINEIKTNASENWKFRVMAMDEPNKKMSNYSAFSGLTTTYSVTFNTNGGNGGPGVVYALAGEQLTVPSVNPTHSNYSFAGWGLNKTAVTLQPNALLNVNANITYYAVWNVTLRIDVKENGVGDYITGNSAVKYSTTNHTNFADIANAKKTNTFINRAFNSASNSVTFTVGVKYYLYVLTGNKSGTYYFTYIMNASGVTVTPKETYTQTDIGTTYNYQKYELEITQNASMTILFTNRSN